MIDIQKHSSSSLALSVPDRPAGLETPTTFLQSRPLNAFNVWKVALRGICQLALQPWTSHIQANKYILATTDSDVTIKVISLTGPVTFGYVITALYHAVNAMFQLRPGFFTCLTRLVLHGQEVGQLKISADTPERSSIDDTGGHALTDDIVVNNTVVVPEVDFKTLNNTLNKNKDNSNHDLILTERETDLDDHVIQIEYEYGRVIQRSDLWTAIFDGIATSAQFDVGARCVYLSAVSISRNLAFHVNELDNHLFTYGMAIRTFWLMAVISIQSRIYKEVEFSVSYTSNGTKIAQGYVLDLGKPSLVGDGEAVASER